MTTKTSTKKTSTEKVPTKNTKNTKNTKKVATKKTNTAVVDKNRKEINGKIIYGLNDKGTELKELLVKRSYSIKTGNPVAGIDQAIENLNIIFSPKKLSVLNFLISKEIKTDDELKRIDELKKESIEILSPVAGIIEDIKNITKNKVLERSRIFKKVNNKPIRFNFLPGELNLFNNLGELETIPASIARASIEIQKIEETGEEFLTLNFVSLLYDKYSEDIENHHWKIIYDLFDKESIKNKKKILEEAEDDL